MASFCTHSHSLLPLFPSRLAFRKREEATHFCTAYPLSETAAPVIAKSGPRGRSANCGPLFANEAALCFSMLSSCRVLARPLMTSFRTSLLPRLCGALFAGSLPTRLIQNLSKPRGAPSTGLPFDGAPSWPNTGSRASRAIVFSPRDLRRLTLPSGGRFFGSPIQKQA